MALRESVKRAQFVTRRERERERERRPKITKEVGVVVKSNRGMIRIKLRQSIDRNVSSRRVDEKNIKNIRPTNDVRREVIRL